MEKMNVFDFIFSAGVGVYALFSIVFYIQTQSIQNALIYPLGGFFLSIIIGFMLTIFFQNFVKKNLVTSFYIATTASMGLNNFVIYPIMNVDTLQVLNFIQLFAVIIQGFFTTLISIGTYYLVKSRF